MNRLPGLRICWGMTFIALACLALSATGCATARTVRVVGANGDPVQNALVVYREVNISPFWNRSQACFTDQAGECKFKSVNHVRVEAFGAASQWGEHWLSSRTTGTVTLSSTPYAGSLVEYYLSKTPKVPETIRLRLDEVRRQ